MRSLLIAGTVATAAIALGGCPYHRQQPIPGPQSPEAARASTGILFFQGTLEEAFERAPRESAVHTCADEQPARYNPPRLGL